MEGYLLKDSKYPIMGLDDDDKTSNKLKIYIEEDNKRFEFEIEHEYLHMSKLLSYLVANPNDEDIKIGINLNVIKKKEMKHIITYMRHYKGIKQPIIQYPLSSTDIFKITNEWNANFINEIYKDNKNDLYNLLKAANYFNIKSLIHLCSATIATWIKGKPIGKIKSILNPNKTD